MHKKKLANTALLMLFQIWLPNALAAEYSVISELHSNPPIPCVAKSIEDRTSGMAIIPTGDSREELRGIMGGMAAVFLSEGANRMTAKNIDVVYTAVFFEEESINEIGVYAYNFREQISPNMFKSHPELNGKFIIIGKNLLVLLWHEDYDKTARCFSAIEKFLSNKQ